jgi:hypothetical protein
MKLIEIGTTDIASLSPLEILPHASSRLRPGAYSFVKENSPCKLRNLIN